ncbi:glutamate ligase domain-containing protein [Streptomyces sp. XD-27]|uniref:glutamate ligase domain-containing protein n=1 Tax=Streptomyces sp. XD-27 TaxID=3062779 RepID=UPI00350E3882
MELSIDEIAAGLNAAQRRSSGRFETIDRPDCVTIYNANPESMRAGLHAFRALASSRRTIAVRAAGRRRGPCTSKWVDWWPNSASTC